MDRATDTGLIDGQGIPVVGFTDFGYITVIFGVGQAFDITSDMQFGVIPRACGNSHINVGGLVGITVVRRYAQPSPHMSEAWRGF